MKMFYTEYDFQVDLDFTERQMLHIVYFSLINLIFSNS